MTVTTIPTIRPGARVRYKGKLGTIMGEPSTSTPRTGPTQDLWHVVYDQPQVTGHRCGCCPDCLHRYRGAHVVTGDLEVLATL